MIPTKVQNSAVPLYRTLQHVKRDHGLRTFPELLSRQEELEADGHVISGLLPARSLGILVGDSGLGKAFTNNAHELAKAVSAVSARGRTALYDAVAEGLVHLQLGQWDKKALIIVSDGGDNASQHKYSQILAQAQRSQVMIYSVGLVDANEEEDPGILRRLSKNTGGIAFFPLSLESVTDISKQIARDLREQYTLGFIPDQTGTSDSVRRIKVEVTAPGHGKVHVRARPGYFRGDQQQSSVKLGKGAS